MKAFLLFLALALPSFTAFAEALSCAGRTPNPVTDVSWTSVFPITLGGIPISTSESIDIGESPPLICVCPGPPPTFKKIGLGITFWEPARAADVSTTPFCSPLLGGDIIGGSGDQVKRGSAQHGSKDGDGFYHVHWFKFPLTSWMAFLTDTVCENSDSFDVVMMSEYEPTWQDDELSTIFSPESGLFATLPAQVVCAADCVAATFGFPFSELFWCAGCQGSMFPLTGNVVNHESGIQASLLATQRMHAKLHRIGVALDVNSVASMCSAQVQPIMNKRSYKTQMVYPIPDATIPANPYGRSEASWSAAHEYPTLGEDFSYIIWRRRVCCAFAS